MPGGEGQFIILLVLVTCGLMAAIWIYLDASEHATNGCAWAAFTVTFWPIVVPLYIYLRIGNSLNRRWRSPSSSALREAAEDEQNRRRSGGDIERAKYLAYVSKHNLGTMYEPPDSLAGRKGYKHFTDGRAETFIEQQRWAEALDYLGEMLREAQRDGDPRREDTYLHYISGIPGGRERLKELAAQPDAGMNGDGEILPPSSSGREPTVPF